MSDSQAQITVRRRKVSSCPSHRVRLLLWHLDPSIIRLDLSVMLKEHLCHLSLCRVLFDRLGEEVLCELVGVDGGVEGVARGGAGGGGGCGEERGVEIRVGLVHIRGLSGCNDIGVDRANFDLIFSTFSVLDDEAVMRKQLHEAREQLVANYNGIIRAQGHRQELIDGLENIVKELLLAFVERSKQRPKQLIFYRDGVSEGQFKQVLEQEIHEIEKAWTALYNEKPKITFVVVQKRHHTRLFPSKPKDRQYADKSGNIRAGTVVDNNICHPTEFDFFLCGHAGAK
ncbi:hypothetical protein ACJX0J_032429, partial [Zea mays]